MPRPKGSKNKVKTTKVTADFAAQIAAKQEEKAAVEAEILKVAASIEELKTDVKSLNADLKAKKASVKKLDKEVAKLEARQAAAAATAWAVSAINCPFIVLPLSPSLISFRYSGSGALLGSTL